MHWYIYMSVPSYIHIYVQLFTNRFLVIIIYKYIWKCVSKKF